VFPSAQSSVIPVQALTAIARMISAIAIFRIVLLLDEAIGLSASSSECIIFDSDFSISHVSLI
jgi:hypothetical protein